MGYPFGYCARKNSLHYSSEEGIEVVLTYMTVIETIKMLGMNAKEFLVRAWREAIYGKMRWNHCCNLFRFISKI